MHGPMSTSEPLLHSEIQTLWPAIDVFSDDSFGIHKNADLRLRSKEQGKPVGYHVRLLRVLQGVRNSLISCDTRVVSLDSSDRYTALSYTWGSPIGQHPIIIDGCQRLISTNLWRFLQQARDLAGDYSGFEWLWIDALSIDQRHPQERAFQVNIMASIFWYAQQVIVWLGPSYGDSDEGMAALSHSVSHPQSEDHFARWNGAAGAGVVGLCQRPYWQRLWVFQELRAARDVWLMCGSRMLLCGSAHEDLWRLLTNFLSAGNMSMEAPRHGWESKAMQQSPAFDMVMQLKSSKINRVQTTLWTLLFSTKHLQCADPRDRVFALLSITTSGHQGILADYSCSLSDLANRVIRNLHCHLRPSSLDEVMRQCGTLCDLLGLEHDAIHTWRSTSASQIKLRSPGLERKLESRSVDYEHLALWAECYGHREVQRLLHGLDSPINLGFVRPSPIEPSKDLSGPTTDATEAHTSACAIVSVLERKDTPRKVGRFSISAWYSRAASRIFAFQKHGKLRAVPNESGVHD